MAMSAMAVNRDMHGALQHSNRISLLDLLNPADKAHFLSTTMDEDIFNAVMDARQAQEGCQSSQDELGNISEDILVDPIPTCAEALSVKTRSRNESAAVLWGSAGGQIQVGLSQKFCISH